MRKRMDAETKAMQEDLKKMGDNQAKAEMIARIVASKAENDAWQARMDARRARLVAFQARRVAWLTDRMNDQKETMACLEETEARLELEDKPASVDTTPEVAREQEIPLEANLEKIEPNPGETEAVVERQETSNEEVVINSPRACQDERTTCQEPMEPCLEGKEEPPSMELKPEVADEEVQLEDAVVMPVGEPKEEELTEMAETTHRDCEEPKSADMKECQETTVCHEATEAEIEKMEPFDCAIAILKQMIAMTKTNHETIATTDLKGNLEGMECEKPASEDTTPEVANDQEIPLKDAEVVPVGEPGKKRRDRRHLAAERRQRKEQKRTQSKHGRRKGLVATRRGTTCRAVVARRRVLFTKTTRSRLIVATREVPRRATVARRRRDATKKERDDMRGAPRERTPGKRRRAYLQGNTATKASDSRRRLRLRDAETAGGLRWENHGNVIVPKIAKRTTRPSARMRTTKDWTLWRGRPPPKRKK
jgi:hypothetical protein